MKKLFCSLLLAGALLFLFSGCDNPNSLQLDLYQGYGSHLKLLHLNASTAEKRERMEALGDALRGAEPLEKDFSLFAYYPDFQLEITPWDNGEMLTAVVDINGEYVDFYYPGPNPQESQTIYRSRMSAKDFKKLVHHAEAP